MKKSNSLKMVEDRQIMSLEHEDKLGITLSESVIENHVRRPLAGYHHDVIPGLQGNDITSATVHGRIKLLLNTNRKLGQPFRIRHRKLLSLSVCKKTSLCCMIDENVPWNTNKRPESPFQNPLLKTSYSATLQIKHS